MIIFVNDFAGHYHHFFDEMTKVIVVLRHAQSAGKQSGQRDYDRPLTAKGEADATAAGKKIIKNNFSPDLILSSSAVRARQTVEYLNEILMLPPQKIRYLPELYEGLAVHWLGVIQQLPDELEQVLLVGHNQSLSVLASSFGNGIYDLAPCELKAFSYEVGLWNEITDLGKEIVLL